MSDGGERSRAAEGDASDSGDCMGEEADSIRSALPVSKVQKVVFRSYDNETAGIDTTMSRGGTEADVDVWMVCTCLHDWYQRLPLKAGQVTNMLEMPSMSSFLGPQYRTVRSALLPIMESR